MAAKLLHSLTDDNPDLQKQIGCMTGIFQIFDRQHIVSSGRQITGHSHRRHHHSVGSRYSNGSLETGSNNAHHQRPASERSSIKNVYEKQTLSTESSRVSFSSSSRSSSFSSLDYNRTTHQEPSDRINFQETVSRDSVGNQPSESRKIGRQSLDLRDVVKDSMYREARGLSVKSTTRDSLRPLQISKSFNAKQDTRVDHSKEPIRVHAKLQQAPWHFNEDSDFSRPLYEASDGSLHTISKNAPRFSYDGREANRRSFELHETLRSVPKLKELPRLSLDGREGLMRNSSTHSQSKSLLKGLEKNIGYPNESTKLIHETPGSQKRPPSVVAKLMGLETLPDSSLASESQIQTINHPIQIYDSPINSWKGPSSPQWKNHDLVMKPLSNSRIPIEPAPWKQMDVSRGSPKPGPRRLKTQARPANRCPSVYSEIENRLKDIEFNQSGKDLRALKQILEAMHAKGLLETEEQEQVSTFATRKNNERKVNGENSRLIKDGSPQRGSVQKTHESQIVIMKPAKALQRNPKHNHIDHAVSSTTKSNTNGRTSRPVQSSSRPQQLPKENSTTSPRLQQKKHEIENRSRPPTPSSSDISKSKRQPPNKQQTESGSPGGKLRPKLQPLQQKQEMHDKLSETSNETRNLSYQNDDKFKKSNINMVLDSKSGKPRSAEFSGSRSPSTKLEKHSPSELLQKKSSTRLDEYGLLAELASVSPEHPSPISVLDTSVYRDDSPSPVDHITNSPNDDGDQMSADNYCGDQFIAVDDIIQGSSLPSVINREKLQNIDNLVQKLRQLNSNHDEVKTDYIASLCDDTSTDHRYISEILLASGLLLRDLSTTFQLHTSGHPINPDLFFVLEQTKFSKGEYVLKKNVHTNHDDEKNHRKLIFNTVNDILIKKLASLWSSTDPCFKPNKVARKTMNAQQLLRELCCEIDQLQGHKLKCGLEEKEDGLKEFLYEDVMYRSESWTDFNGDISGLVLDVERSLFKELVNEVVLGEAENPRTKPGRRQRKLFAS